ncbi:MAG: oligosaccharide flippase family protein [Colwellia sp.]
MPSLKKNIIFNYLGQFYRAFIGILILPLYLQELGGEAFGLIGFFTLLLACMQLINLGLTPTLGREVARLKGDPKNSHELRTVVRSLEVVFMFIAAFATATIFLSRNWVAVDWLSINELDTSLVATSVGLMAFMVGLRWLSSLYMSGINAYEQQVWINVVGICIATFRFPGALAVILISKGDLLLFFAYQIIVAFVECIIYAIKLKKIMPPTDTQVNFSSSSLKRIAPFALSIGYTAGIWVLVTQLDKLLLSKILPLAEYGYFTLIATLAGGILFLSSPLGRAILPRMTSLIAKNNEREMLKVYMKGTGIVSAVVSPIVLVIAFFPKEVVYIWTGSEQAAEWVASILPLYVIGYGLLTIGAFQFYLQYAYGKLKQHVIFNTVSALISVPLVVYSAYNFGPIGVAWVWFVFRLLSLLFWAPYIHHKFAPGIHFDWLMKRVFPPIFISITCLLILNISFEYQFSNDRLMDLFYISAITSVLLLASFGIIFFREIRVFIREKI